MSDTDVTTKPNDEHEAPEFIRSEAVLRSIPLLPLLAARQLLVIFSIYLFVLALP